MIVLDSVSMFCFFQFLILIYVKMERTILNFIYCIIYLFILFYCYFSSYFFLPQVFFILLIFLHRENVYKYINSEAKLNSNHPPRSNEAPSVQQYYCAINNYKYTYICIYKTI